VHRGKWIEDPLDQALRDAELGEVSGGGTLQAADGEIERADVELSLRRFDAKTLAWLREQLDRLGVPKGSRIVPPDEQGIESVGRLEGMAVYLNGTELSEETYRDCDIDFVIAECQRLLGDAGRIRSFWEGPRDTALYFYGEDFARMHALLTPFLASYPLCARCRVTQIA
jgi:hypothetical protein